MNQKNSKNQMPRLKSKYLYALLFLIFFVWTTFYILKNLSDVQPTKTDSVPLYESNEISLNELFSLGSCLLSEASKRIVKIRSNSNELKLDRKKQDNSIVTQADVESHTLIVHALDSKYNGKLKVISEENNNKDAKHLDSNEYLSLCNKHQVKSQEKDIVKLKDVTVWIDPLDATQEFSENLTEYVTVMFCIAYKGRPQAGIIHNPFSNTTVKSFFEKKKLPNELSDSKDRVIISRSHSGSVVNIIKSKLKKAKIITAAGSGFKALTLISDKADVYLHSGKISKWDICAPNAILESYGGKLTKLNGQEIDYSYKNTEPYLIDTGIVASVKDHKYFVKLFGN